MQRRADSKQESSRTPRPSVSPRPTARGDLFPETFPSELPEAKNERYTTRETLAWCLERAGLKRYTLDVAACLEAHCADRFYTRAADGLQQPWFGDVWCNPPWDEPGPWVDRAWHVTTARACSSVSMLLPGNRTEQPWWHEMVEPWRDGRRLAGSHGFPSFVALTTHFLPKRTVFGCPGNREGIGAGSPPFTSVLLLFRVHPVVKGASP